MPAARKNGKAPPVSRATTLHPELIEVETEKGRHPTTHQRLPKQIKIYLERCKLLGMQTKQMAWELHVVQGRSKCETARLLGVSQPRIWQVIDEARREILGRAPVAPEDFIMMREELKDRLLATYEDACKRLEITTIDQETGENVVQEMEAEPDPRMLAIRLKALDQLAKLYGLNLETATEDKGQGERYATPEEIREVVMQRALEQHGRAGDVAEAVKALKAG